MTEYPVALRSPCTYGRESLCDVWNDIQPLLYLHWREIATHQDIPLQPIRAYYDAGEASGVLRIFTVRDILKNLIGYAVYLVAPNAHYGSCLQANQDVLYVHPDWRRGGLAARLIRFCDDRLREDGVQVVAQHVKLAHPVLSVLLERAGYQAVETIYTKRLDS